MRKIINLWPFFVFFIIFKNWFVSPFLTAYDWPFFYTETLWDFPLFPPAWAPTNGIGLGGEVVLYALDSYVYFLVALFVNFLGLSWEIVYKLFIFGLFIFLSIISSISLIKTVLCKVNILLIFLSTLLFTTNTYILMIVDGGQVGVALAYALSPLVLAAFINLVNKPDSTNNSKCKYAIIAGMALSSQVMFDARIAYITMIAVALYYLFSIRHYTLKKIILCVVLVPLGITLLLHASWILPLLVFQSSPVQEIINRHTSPDSFRFFSFSSFSQTFSLLHPNWPENIFGKVSFMKSEFLLLPILAYLALFFLSEKYKKTIAFFVCLGIIGAFLAKGANEPFGVLNQFFYLYIPGMSMFRDPTKFYLLIALSYMILIPFSLFQISTLVSKLDQTNEFMVKVQKNLSNILLLFVICYLLFLIRPVFFDQLRGTFKQHSIPQEYINLKNFLVAKPTFFRTLWIPQPHRYNFYSYTHPVVFGDSLLKASSSAEVVNLLSQEKTKQYLSDASVRYIIVPYDSFGEIFMHDRKYDEKQYQNTVSKLNKVPWLKKIDGFGKIVVYETPNIKNHFRINGRGDVSYKMIRPFEYEVNISNLTPGFMVFGESYNPYWVAQIEGKKIKSLRTKEGFNSFLLEHEGKYKVYFEKQKVYEYGRIISVTSLFLILILLWRLRKR